jgi:hypothetical protein
MSSAVTESDSWHLKAAEGWLGLGNRGEAQAELAALGPSGCWRPEGLRERCVVWGACGYWEGVTMAGGILSKIKPSSSWGWFYHAMGLHRLKKTKEARELLLGVVQRFPRNVAIHYALACFAGRLGNLEEARKWWGKVESFGNRKRLKEVAAREPDLKALWEKA